MERGLSSEVGPVGRLFKDCVDLFWVLLQRISTLDQFDQQKKSDLRDEFGKFFFWGDGYLPYEGRLDEILSHSTRLRRRVLSLMSEIGDILCDRKRGTTIPDVSGLFALADPKGSDAKLAAQRKEVEFLIGSLRGDSDDTPESLDGSDDSSDTNGSGDPLEEVIGELHTYIRSLVDLAPSLERPAPDANAKELEARPAVTSTLLGPAEIWCRRIIDRYEGIDIKLAERLGEANWRRFQRVTQWLENAGGDDDDSDEGYCKDEEDTVPELPNFPRPTDRDSLPHSSSTFKDSGLGTTVATVSTPSIAYSFRALPKMAHADVASQTTYASTLSEESEKKGWLRVPPLPEGAISGNRFRCTVCGDKVRNIMSRVDWKRHVFSDLEPYICTFQGCKGGISTFPSRKLWVDHEFSQHHFRKLWACRDCTIIFDEQDLFQQHISAIHGYFYTETRLATITAASERRMPQRTEDLTCPFCAFREAPTRQAFARHVGRHMEEIALGVLPRGTGSDDERGSGSSNQSHSKVGIVGDPDMPQVGTPNQIMTPQLPADSAHEAPPATTEQPPSERVYRLYGGVDYPPEKASGEPFPTFPQSGQSPIPKSGNIPPLSEERKRQLESIRIQVLKSGGPKEQLEWAEDALGYVRILTQHARGVAGLGSVQRIRADAVGIVFRLADQGQPKAEYLKGLVLEFALHGQGADKEMDNKMAFKSYQSAAKGGYDRAEYRMGMQYENSHEIDMAIACYERGACLGDSGCIYKTGMMMLLGEHGRQVDFFHGIRSIFVSAEAADLDFPHGAYVYGMLLAGRLPGVAVPTTVLRPDPKAAKAYIERAAYLWHAKAQVEMGRAYELSELGCEFHPDLSVHYNLLAAHQGEAEAQMALSKWFLAGHEGSFERDEGMAFTYANIAALGGYPPAEYAMGYYHEVGVFVPVNTDEARRWYEMAEEHGSTGAKEKLERLERSGVRKGKERTEALETKDKGKAERWEVLKEEMSEALRKKNLRAREEFKRRIEKERSEVLEKEMLGWLREKNLKGREEFVDDRIGEDGGVEGK
ncbi:hypothetical protein GP486_004202 [Trichoglossum hirsutum]|uniref:C2H2-type domain-containing protein n=1 Tax=Trichoglossum hirsutum TaxID=265104 RepID=A0A9P8RPH4_9PEZI|nr:hypothetical protein GP486_004202 [Trichoglossum hirsutum]